MKQFCMKIDLISQRRENVLFLPSNMAAMTSHESTVCIEISNHEKNVQPQVEVSEATYCCDIVLKVLVLVVTTMNCEIKPHQHDSHKS